ncbi:antA/AntB antirepressor family protein [Microbacterium sp. KKR3/1]|uniref:antA/AntB antirepressor family protein n=1 Tax=Microbacterium sp. KKR3/1 TaxID=2904241 RepID=UPI001E471E27|nr:antA/AntB antirepressor family protein [Microbacterium sp. KKR3/1]MCE0510888.1 antA/AntB antirepressor family protein [Microbacterium sp. KKR3/1]
MNALIPIREHDGRQAVSGRELHAFLEVGARYSDWFPRMLAYGFAEGEDYALISEYVRSEERGRDYAQADHVLTLDMAKELAMIQRTDKGKQARQYFIEVEKRVKQNPAIPDISTPEGILALAQQFTRTAEELVAAKHEVAALTPLAAQAHVHNLGKEFTTRQDFAREIVKWALYNGIKVTAPQVFEFLARKLDMFVTGNREDNGDATLSGERRGLSTTVKGTSTVNGFAFHTGKLTPKGVEYAWSRAQKYIIEHGDLVLRSKEIEQ